MAAAVTAFAWLLSRGSCVDLDRVVGLC
jgi:hypothetical protein